MSKGENLRTLEAEVKQAKKVITFSTPAKFVEQSNQDCIWLSKYWICSS